MPPGTANLGSHLPAAEKILSYVPHSPAVTPPQLSCSSCLGPAQDTEAGACSEEEQAELSVCLLWSPLHEALVEITVQDTSTSQKK